MPERPEAGGHSQAPAVDVLALEWTRVQVTIRMRPAAGSRLDPDAIRLERSGASTPAMAPTHAEVRDGVLAARFNVMQGPGQVPLDPGRWRLVVEDPGHRHRTPIVVTGQIPIEPARHAAAFTLAEGDYRVVPEVDPMRQWLTLAISLVAPGGAAGASGGAAGAPDGAAGAPDGAAGAPLPPLPPLSPLARLRESMLRPVRRGRPILFAASLRIARIAARRNGRRILFTSDSRSELGGNLELVHDRMVERGLDRDYELLTLFKPGIVARRSFRDRFRLPWLLARADTIVIDDYQPVIYRVNIPDVRIVQLWHAVGAFKTVGYSRVGKPGGPNPYGRIHKNYSRVTVSAHGDIPVYAEAFGIPEERVVATGVPRTDRFFDPAYATSARALALEAFPEARGRTTILFAPTFRGHGARTATYDFGRLDYGALHALCVEKDAVCIVRMHPFVRDPLGIPEALGDRILDGQRSSIDVNDLLFGVDLLVTDYSSIVYEFSTFGRPMLFYAYDLEEYVAARDFYEPYEDFVPGRIVRTFEELVDAIRRDDCQVEKVVPFADRHFDRRDAGSTDRVVDLIIAG